MCKVSETLGYLPVIYLYNEIDKNKIGIQKRSYTVNCQPIISKQLQS